MAVDQQLIQQMLDQLTKQQATLDKYNRYYNGDHDINRNYRMQDSMSNMKVVFNFPKKFTNNLVGYLLGKALTYSSKSGNDEVVHAIDKHISQWEKAHNQQLAKLSEIFGWAYEINYINPLGQFRATAVSPMQMYHIDDGTAERNIVLAVHRYTKQFDKNIYIDVYDDQKISTFTVGNGQLTFTEEKEHIFGRVPVSINLTNAESECGFKQIIGLVDALNNIHSDSINEIGDHRAAMLVIEGGKVEEQDLINFKKSGIIQTPTGVKASWLIKDIKSEFIQNEIKNIRDDIFLLSDQVDFNQNWASNTSSMALRNKLLDLSHRISLKFALLEQTLYQRLTNLFRFLYVRDGVSYDVTDIRIKPTLDLPFDITAIADGLSKMDFLSQETKLSYLDTIDNPLVEIEKFRKEQEYNLQQELKRTDSMGFGGSNG